LKPITLCKRIIKRVKKYDSASNLKLIEQAFFLAKDLYKKKNLVTDYSLLEHALNTAYRLSELKVDKDTIIAAILHDSVYCSVEAEDKIKELFGEEVYLLIKDIEKLNKIKYLDDMDANQLDILRKLYLSTVQDLRSILIRLAERLNYLEIIENKDVLLEKEIHLLARETMDVLVPLADGLGVWDLKWRLEDLSFKYLNIKAYKMIDSHIKDSKSKMRSYIRRVSVLINKELKRDNIFDSDITGRVKNLYSIYKKIIYKNRDINEIYDIIAIRIVVKNISECYQVLGLIHHLWRPVTYRIKDYIAVPKMNSYRSLHTTVFCLDNHMTEIQIRTKEMNEEAEFGLAAHLIYGQKKVSLSPDKEQHKWIESLKNLKYENYSDSKLKDQYEKRLKINLFNESIFVYTPKGHIKDLPTGSTSIDFAYSIHSDLGNSCIGAKINGKMVALKTELKNGDIIEIISRDFAKGPKREWLKFVKTSRANNKIKAFLKKKERNQNIKIGKEILLKGLSTYNKKLTTSIRKNILEKTAYENIDAVFKAIGEKTISIESILNKIFKTVPVTKPRGRIKKVKKTKEVIVEGEKNYKIRFAKCCNPKNTDELVGYITIGKDISVHSKECTELSNLKKDRILKVSWKNTKENFAK